MGNIKDRKETVEGSMMEVRLAETSKNKQCKMPEESK
jgi:hypothetical protein